MKIVIFFGFGSIASLSHCCVYIALYTPSNDEKSGARHHLFSLVFVILVVLVFHLEVVVDCGLHAQVVDRGDGVHH